MTFAWPWAFLGLLSIPALAVIYWLRMRARRQPVSSLLLWREEVESRSGGRRFERFEASRLFLLELLILLLLVLAAAGPRGLRSDARRPLVVVLDDSFSMSAGGERSPRSLAEAALWEELAGELHSSVTLVMAGEQPQVVDESALSAEDVAVRLASWRVRAPVARIEESVALAGDLGGGRARILVLSDHAPPTEVESGRLVWRAFGRAIANVAFVNVVRSAAGGGEGTDGCLAEVANFSPRPATVRLEVVVGTGGAAVTQEIALAAGELGRMRFKVPAQAKAELRLSPSGLTTEALDLDDRAVLLPTIGRSVRVRLELGDEELRELIGEAVKASGRAILSGNRPEVVIRDSGQGGEEATGSWSLQVVAGDPAVPYLGPFVLDRAHPLASGLSLGGVIWGVAEPGGDAEKLDAGRPVITAGDVALLRDREMVDGRHRLTLYWSHTLSTLQRTPNWPVLWLNLLEWRARSIPGVRESNLRLGSWAAVGLVAGAEVADLELPDGTVRRLQTRGESLRLRAEEVGIHRLRHGGRTDQWAVNALAAEESDLRQATSGRWGSWQSDETRWELRDLTWIPALLAVACLLLHLRWTTVSGDRRG